MQEAEVSESAHPEGTSRYRPTLGPDPVPWAQPGTYATKGPAGGRPVPSHRLDRNLEGGSSSPCGHLHLEASPAISQTANTDL